jgi:hypothetical protein
VELAAQGDDGVNTIKVMLTQEEATARRAFNELRRRHGQRKPIPEALASYLLPRVRVAQYVDEEENRLGECWIWTLSVSGQASPRARLDGRSLTVRRWAAQQMREKPIPESWLVINYCGTDRCVNPHCCVPLQRSKARAILHARCGIDIEAMRLAVALARRAASKVLWAEKVQLIRDQRAASVLAGAPITYAALGEQHGIHERTVGHLIRGDRWDPGLMPTKRPVASVFDLGRLAA